MKTLVETPPKMNKGNGFQVSLPIRTTIGHRRPPKRANNEHIPKFKKVHYSGYGIRGNKLPNGCPVLS